MTITIDLPQVGESVVEGIIGKWLKKPGDKLEKYDPLVEVITDKVTMEVPSPVDGVLTRILVEEGETVPMGAPIAEIEGDESQITPATRAAPMPANALKQGSQESAKGVGTVGYLMKDVKPVGPTGGGMEEPGSADSMAAQGSLETRRRYSPAVSRIARELNVDMSRVTGTGSGGRINRNDVVKYAESQATRATAAPTVPAQGARVISASMGPDEEVISLSPVRRIIAQHMVKSATEIPHAWSMIEADVSSLVKYRQGLKEEFQRREGVDLTYLPFVIKAVVESLKEYPMMNSAWDNDKIILKRRIHIGVAAAAPDGLVVPVIHDADSLSIAALAKAVRELTSKARQGSLTLPEVQGGTFTVNNTGALGSIVSQPIINHPQAAILTTEAIQKRAVVVDDAIAIRSMMNVCLSFDHRIVDGAESAAFLESVKRRFEALGPGTPIY